jgi:hypothetical protein
MFLGRSGMRILFVLYTCFVSIYMTLLWADIYLLPYICIIYSIIIIITVYLCVFTIVYVALPID